LTKADADADEHAFQEGLRRSLMPREDSLQEGLRRSMLLQEEKSSRKTMIVYVKTNDGRSQYIKVFPEDRIKEQVN
jgi:hypothetical protein